jgi:threonine dehydrogenase-like Zn-dependent dehydrogenase
VDHQQLKDALRRFKPYFPISIQMMGANVWRQVELPVAAVLERRQLIDVHRVIWPAAEVADFEAGRILGPTAGAVLVKVAYSVMSPGTERAQFLGLPGVLNHDEVLVYYPGYSGSGTVQAVGQHVQGLQVGDRVAGRISHASYATVDPGLLFKVPPDVALEQAAFIELGVIGLQGIHKAQIKPGESVVVLGQGLVGQLADRFCRLAGAAPVVGVARSRSKANVALVAGGVDEFVTVEELRANGAPRTFDVVIDATGDANIVPFALSLACPGGRVIGLGTPQGQGPVPLGQLAARPDVTFTAAHISGIPQHDQTAGLWTYRNEAGLFLDLLDQDRLDMTPLITQRRDPAQAADVYTTLKSGGAGLIGLVFDWTTY